MHEKKILIISSEYPPNICGGLGTHVASITEHLRSRFLFEVITRDGFDYAPLSDSIRVHTVSMPTEYDNVACWIAFCKAAVERIGALSLDFDVVHCHDWMTIPAGVTLRARYHRPLIFNVHLPQIHGPTMLIERLGIVAADHVIVNSVAARNEIRQLHQLSAPMSVIPNGVDTDYFSPAPHKRDDGYILFVGRLVPQKGVATLLQALAVLLRRVSTRLIVVGDGHLELFLQRCTRSLGISDCVRYVGWRTKADLLSWYQGAKFVVMPSFYEPFGIVALEAMACGRPVIASNTGGLAEIIDDGVNGFLVPVGDYLSLASRMFRLLTEADTLYEMGAAARARAQQFAWPSVVSELAELIQTLWWQEWERGHSEFIAAYIQEIPYRDLFGFP